MDKPLPDGWHPTIADAIDRLGRRTGGRPFSEVLTHGTLRVGLYAPREVDDQRPHEQDEVYVVMSGTGTFVNGDLEERFGPGDVLFVPAGRVHRFENFTDDLYLWVVFYGAPGGE